LRLGHSSRRELRARGVGGDRSMTVTAWSVPPTNLRVAQRASRSTRAPRTASRADAAIAGRTTAGRSAAD